MKNFIITIGALIVIFTILAFQTDINGYRRMVYKVEEAANEVVEGCFFVSDEGMRKGELAYDYESIITGISTLEHNLPEGMEYEGILRLSDEEGKESSEIKIIDEKIYASEKVRDTQTKGSFELVCTYKPFSLIFLRDISVEIKVERRGELISH